MTDDMTDIHASYLHWVDEASAYRLAELAGCGAPDSPTSPGAEILTEVRDAVVDAWREAKLDWETDRYDIDTAMDCAAEGIIPVYTVDRFALFMDLCAWGESNENTADGTWTGTMEDIAVDAIGQITERLAVALVAEIRKDFDDIWQCPGCGDMGTPHLCLPGNCRATGEERGEHQATLAESAVAAPEPVEVPAEVPADAPHLADPLYRLIVEREQGSDVTAEFMSRMEQVNIAEFAERQRAARRRRITAIVVLVVAGLALLTVGIGRAGGWL